MKSNKASLLHGALVASFLLVGALGCELIASVDRDKIDEGASGSGGGPPVDSGPGGTGGTGGTGATGGTGGTVTGGTGGTDTGGTGGTQTGGTGGTDDAGNDSEPDAPDDVTTDVPDDVTTDALDAADDTTDAADALDESDPCFGVTCNECEVCVNGTCENANEGTPCTGDGNDCTVDECSGGVCTHPNAAPGATCTDDGNDCTNDVCAGSTCTHPDKSDGVTCTDEGDSCTTDTCQSGVCEHDPIANDCGTAQCGASPSGCYQCGACDAPPPDACDTVDPNKLLDYPDTGTCNAGTCDYTATEITCTNGCTNGACDFVNGAAACGTTAAGTVTATFSGDVTGGIASSTAFNTTTSNAGQSLPDAVKIQTCAGNGGLLNIYLYLNGTTTLPVAYELDDQCGHTYSPTSGGCAILEILIPDTGGDIFYTTGDTNWAGSGTFDSVTYGTNTISASFVATGLVDTTAPTSTASIAGGSLTNVPFPF